MSADQRELEAVPIDRANDDAGVKLSYPKLDAALKKISGLDAKEEE